MGSPGRGKAVPIIIAVVAALGLSGCAGGGLGSGNEATWERETARLAAALAAAPPASPGVLRVRLAFGADADLDLYVTDPRQETVYFANNPTRSGGALAEDVRCGAPEPHVEVVTFRDPLPGVYRVGVDYPKHCRGRDDPASYVVVVEQPGGGREERRGAIDLLHFAPIVIESRVGAP